VRADFEVVIGLEVHAELKTQTKIFCSCPNQFGALPNSNVCPVCSGMPGVLPVLNERAVEYAMLAGLALNCEVADFCKFDRKNYFYPDLPKAYQISQFDLPICKTGWVEIESADGTAKRVGINRLHMEEDAGKLVHQGTITTTAYSLVDLNRCGVPLIEIVSEPDMRTSQEARLYMEKLRAILLFLGVSDCKMEEGSLRCDANISIRPWGQKELGTKSEIKNLNSFRSLERALEYEIERQVEIIEDCGQVVQETRTWDEGRGVTESMRSKEEAHDYRYFPDPDLVPLKISREWVAKLQAAMPELPDDARHRLQEELGLSAYDASLLTATPQMLAFFDRCAALAPDAKQVANWMMGDLTRLMNQQGLEDPEARISPENLAFMLRLIADGTISGKIAKKVFEEMFATGKDAGLIIKEQGLVQISDASSIVPVIDQVIADNPKAVEDYRSGKAKAMGSLVGQVMKATKGKANPEMVNKLLVERLEGI
jgi:aspartyl-tRNA(Asn)/glutamyl-tRNA(Gln) amidotransferase subunit B